MAPERFQKGAADARSDVYALTCVLHESLIGQPPFPSNTLEQIIAAHMLQPPPQPSALRGGIPAGLDHVIATGMAKDPDQRYGTTKELAQAARGALTTPARRPTVPAPPRVEQPKPQTPRATPPPAPMPTPPPAPLPPVPLPTPPPAPPPAPPNTWPAGGPTTPAPFAPRGYSVAPGAGFYPPPPPPVGYPPQPPSGLITIPSLGTVTAATSGQRLGARLIDWVTYAIAYAACMLICAALASPTSHTVTDAYGRTTTESSGMGAAAIWIGYFTWIAICVFYEWLMTASKGATLGKMAVGIKVVNETTGQVLGHGPAFVRTFVPFIAGAVLCCVPGLVFYMSPLFDSSGRLQGWHDKFAHDLVIKTR
jgi:uncharacterized RDD family membrane protein YckC